MSTPISSMQHCTKGPSWCNKQEKETLKHTHTHLYIHERKKVKLSLITEDIIIYAENPKNLHKKPARTKWLTKITGSCPHIFFKK